MTTLLECTATEQFLDNPTPDSFTAVYQIFVPQLVSFFRRRGHQTCVAEDLAQDVMLTVYRKAGQVRDRALFRGWLFKVARHAMCRYFARLSREVTTIELTEDVVRAAAAGGETSGFEFHDWMEFLTPLERDAVRLRFVEEWEYHEIAAAQATPIGTIQWRVFKSKKKLAVILGRRADVRQLAA